jgi:hypothetical protein
MLQSLKGYWGEFQSWNRSFRSVVERVFCRKSVPTLALLTLSVLVALGNLVPCVAADLDKEDFASAQFARGAFSVESVEIKNVPMLVAGLAGSRMFELASAPPLLLPSIPPLYTSPVLADEGVWVWRNMPTEENGQPLAFRTTYRPSVNFPNAIVYMLLLDMKRVSPKFYLGSAEEGGSATSARIEAQDKSNLVAVTNGLWKWRHSGGGGIIFRGKELKKLKPGLATIVVYKNGSMDILEWNDSLPKEEISDARQLKRLIVSEGKVVESEIGLGSLLDEARPTQPAPADNPNGERVMNFTSGANWFIATRSAFGIREDGNLVFAVGHHIGTKDLAKALALAGCVRAIHGDANPGNCVGSVYLMDGQGKILGVEKLSPKQDDFTSKRYVSGPVPSDFYAFFKKTDETPAH